MAGHTYPDNPLRASGVACIAQANHPIEQNYLMQWAMRHSPTPGLPNLVATSLAKALFTAQSPYCSESFWMRMGVATPKNSPSGKNKQICCSRMCAERAQKMDLGEFSKNCRRKPEILT